MTLLEERTARVTPPPAAELVRRITDLAALPLNRATTLPPAAYWSAELYDLEVERIFRRDWMCVARADEIAEPGSWIAVDLVGEPLIITKDEDGALHCLSRVCRHRAIDILAGQAENCGSAARLRCPYHLWSYKLDGSLIGAPEMNESEIFDKSELGLIEFPLEVWKGFVFVNLDRGAAPLRPQMGFFDDLVGGRDIASYKRVGAVEWGTTEVNWKVVIENGSECYHHMGTHKDTLQTMWPAQNIFPEGSMHGFTGRMVTTKEVAVGEVDGWPISPTLFPIVEDLTPEQMATTYVVGGFPMFFFALGPDHIAWFKWLPAGPTSHSLSIELLVPEQVAALPDVENLAAMAVAMVREIQAEDATTNEAVMVGSRSAVAQQGPLSHLEGPLHWFQQYLAMRLGD